jgi:hypothetical protein
MSTRLFTRTLATGALAVTLVGGAVSSSHAIPLPVTSAHQIAGPAPTQQVYWRGGGWGWRGGWGGGYGWGWRRPGFGGAFAAGAIVGGALGLATAAAASPYAYGYPSYGYYPAVAAAPVVYQTVPAPVVVRRVVYRPAPVFVQRVVYRSVPAYRRVVYRSRPVFGYRRVAFRPGPAFGYRRVAFRPGRAFGSHRVVYRSRRAF